MLEDGEDTFDISSLDLAATEIAQRGARKRAPAKNAMELFIRAAGPPAQSSANRKKKFDEYEARMSVEKRRSKDGNAAAAGETERGEGADGESPPAATAAAAPPQATAGDSG